MPKYNLGCGDSKFSGYINCDVNPAVNPDLVLDLRKPPFPIEANYASEVLLFHTIEHLEKPFHLPLFQEIRRILKPGGMFYLSYPEFAIVAEHWLENTRGMREFWEATIVGRQSRPDDYHLSLMSTPEVEAQLKTVGFSVLSAKPEKLEPFNTVILAEAVVVPRTYEEALAQEILDA